MHQRHRQTTDRQTTDRQTTDGRPIAYSKRNVIRWRLLKTELFRRNGAGNSPWRQSWRKKYFYGAREVFVKQVDFELDWVKRWGSCGWGRSDQNRCRNRLSPQHGCSSSSKHRQATRSIISLLTLNPNFSTDFAFKTSLLPQTEAFYTANDGKCFGMWVRQWLWFCMTTVADSLMH